jgi:hypothetical protein
LWVARVGIEDGIWWIELIVFDAFVNVIPEEEVFYFAFPVGLFDAKVILDSGLPSPSAG